MLPTTPPPDEPGSVLEPPRFSLRTLLLIVTAFACFFAAMAAIGMFWSLVLMFFSALILAHVLGNSLGTRLRDNATRQRNGATGQQPRDGAAPGPSETAPPRDPLKQSRLAQCTRLKRVTLIMAVLGALVGGSLGGSGLASLYPEADAGAVVLGVVSSAVLGAFAGFFVSSFVSVFRQALREALDDCDPVVRRTATRQPKRRFDLGSGK